MNCRACLRAYSSGTADLIHSRGIEGTVECQVWTDTIRDVPLVIRSHRTDVNARSGRRLKDGVNTQETHSVDNDEPQQPDAHAWSTFQSSHCVRCRDLTDNRPQCCRCSWPWPTAVWIKEQPRPWPCSAFRQRARPEYLSCLSRHAHAAPFYGLKPPEGQLTAASMANNPFNQSLMKALAPFKCLSIRVTRSLHYPTCADT